MMRPLGPRIAVRKIKPVEVTKSGLFIPGVHDLREQRGKVVSVGRILDVDGEEVPMEIEVGDTVLYDSYKIIPIKTPELDEILIIRLENVYGVVVEG